VVRQGWQLAGWLAGIRTGEDLPQPPQAGTTGTTAPSALSTARVKRHEGIGALLGARRHRVEVKAREEASTGQNDTVRAVRRSGGFIQHDSRGQSRVGKREVRSFRTLDRGQDRIGTSGRGSAEKRAKHGSGANQGSAGEGQKRHRPGLNAPRRGGRP
jgi:hypothetical protein